MRSFFHLFIVLFLVSALGVAYAQTNTTLQYQGSLFNSQGAPVTTNKTITFRLFNDVETGESGDALWTETLAVDIADGFFTVPLGSVNAFDESTFRETELWLELEIDSETLSPRQPVAAVPWARRAFSVEGKVEATSITSEGSVTVGGSEVINASGQWVGSTQMATDLNCSGCVDTSEVSFNVCIADESGNAAYADEAGDADTVGGYSVDESGTGQANTIPLLDENGKIPAEILPFNQGDLLAPADRQLVQGLDGYLLDYFRISGLGIEGSLASSVKQGKSFGPGDGISGNLLPFAWYQSESEYNIYNDFESDSRISENWSYVFSPSEYCSFGRTETNKANGELGELTLSFNGRVNNNQSCKASMNDAIYNRHIFVKYFLKAGVMGNRTNTAKISFSGFGEEYICEANLPGIDETHSSSYGTIVAVALGGNYYDIYINGILRHNYSYIPDGIVIKLEIFPNAAWPTPDGQVVIDDIRVSKYSLSNHNVLDCNDNLQCTIDYYSLDPQENCVHLNVTGNCDDSNACTENDTCAEGECHGTDVDCNDDDTYTTDRCDTLSGCYYETCPYETYTFNSSQDNWTLTGDWNWNNDNGWISITSTNGQAQSPNFPHASNRVRLRVYRIGEGGLTVYPGGVEVTVPYSDDWYEADVDLASATNIQLVHTGSGSIRIDKVEVLDPCEEER